MAKKNGRLEWRRIGALAAAVMLALTLGACKGKGEESSSEIEGPEISDTSVFPEGTEKIGRASCRERV